MRHNKTLDEARKYLLYVSDALNGVAGSYSIGKKERDIVAKYAADLYDYAKGLERLNDSISARQQEEKHS
jgi:hypothetical protein